MRKKQRGKDCRTLTDIPNIGPATARDLQLLGIAHPQHLRGCDPFLLYERLCGLTGKRHDPCVMDVLLSAIRFMDGAPARPWWEYTQERKATLLRRSNPTE